MNAVAFEIPGKPFAKQRPRFTRQGRAYTPQQTVSFERSVAVIATQHFQQPISGPVKIEIIAVFEPATSWSKKRRLETLGKPHTQRPDFDNLQKAICDALNRIAYADDAQISSATCIKVWGEPAKTIVSVKPIEVGNA